MPSLAIALPNVPGHFWDGGKDRTPDFALFSWDSGAFLAETILDRDPIERRGRRSSAGQIVKWG